MEIIIILLLIGAAISFGAAAFGVAARVNLVALGLLFWVITVLIGALSAA